MLLKGEIYQNTLFLPLIYVSKNGVFYTYSADMYNFGNILPKTAGGRMLIRPNYYITENKIEWL